MSDLIDASIVLTAHDGDEIITSDIEDLQTFGGGKWAPCRARSPLAQRATIANALQPNGAGLAEMRNGPTVIPKATVIQIERMAPPSTGIIVPVTYDAAGDSKKAATRPNSSGSPYLRNAMCSDCLARASSGSPARASISRTRSVAIRTGKSPLIRTPAGPCSSASVFTTPASPGNRPFEMARSGRARVPTRPIRRREMRLSHAEDRFLVA